MHQDQPMHILLLLNILLTLHPLQRDTPFVKNDTMFINREVNKAYYHAVFIDRNRQSNNYKKLINFKFTRQDKVDLKDSYHILKQYYQKPLKHHNLEGLPTEWMPLYRYKGKFYIYSPSEWGNIDRRIVTDTTLIYWSMEPPTPQPIISLTKVNATKYVMDVQLFYPNKVVDRITIHIIDAKNNIAVWEDSLQPPAHRYGFYIARKNAANFDMIVNYCRTDKMPEFMFDKVDYAKLLKGK